jgi:hypothetical protein
MPVVDRTVDDIRDIDARVRVAKTFGEVLSLADRRHQLQLQARAAARQLGAFAGGWKYLPPR